MAKRGRAAQSRHNRKVEQRASALQKRGFKVQADLAGHPRPESIGGRIPDIVARRGSELIVEEIETPRTLKADRPQQEAIREGTQARGGKFFVRVARP